MLRIQYQNEYINCFLNICDKNVEYKKLAFRTYVINEGIHTYMNTSKILASDLQKNACNFVMIGWKVQYSLLL